MNEPQSRFDVALGELGDGVSDHRLARQRRRISQFELEQADRSQLPFAWLFSAPWPAQLALAATLLLLIGVVVQGTSPIKVNNGAQATLTVDTPASAPKNPASAPKNPLAADEPSRSTPETLAAPAKPLVATLANKLLKPGQVLQTKTDQRIDFGGAGAIKVVKHSRASITEIAGNSFALGLESGALHATITPNQGNHFRINAGPFEVRVIGTVFSVDWQPGQKRFNLAVDHGKVSVTDVRSGEQSFVTAGESFTSRLDANKNPTSIKATDSKRAEALPASNDKSDSSGAREEARPEAPAPEPVQPSVAEWRTLAEAGEYQAAYAAAKHVGIAQLAASANPSELLLLADASRLAGASDDARSTLLALRQRYPNHANAVLAGFVLGRIAFEKHQDIEAQKWLKGYLVDHPAGPLAEGARSRILTLAQRSKNSAAIAAAAQDYLAHHATGQRAGEARRILNQ